MAIYIQPSFMYILGISSYAHESLCTLIRDGRIVCLFEEERFNIQKHTSEFPCRAINAVQEFEGIQV